MPVLIGNEIVQHDHAVEKRHSVPYADCLAAVYKVLINRDIIWLFLHLYDTPCRDQLPAFVREILTDGVRRTFVPRHRVRHMGNAETLHHTRCDHLVKGLLTKGVGAALNQTPFAVYHTPALFQVAVRGVVRGAEIQRIAFAVGAEQDVANIIGEGIGKEVDLIPGEVCVLRADPILVGKAQPIAFHQQRPCACDVQRFHSRIHGLRRRRCCSPFPCTTTPRKRTSYRLRSLLGYVGLEDLVVYANGIFSFNPEIKVVTDVGLFEELCDSIEMENNPKKRYRLYEAAVGLYSGNLLPRLSDNIYFIPSITYYQGLYFRLAGRYIERQTECGEYVYAHKAAKAALAFDPFNSSLNMHLTILLYQQSGAGTANAFYTGIKRHLTEAHIQRIKQTCPNMII